MQGLYEHKQQSHRVLPGGFVVLFYLLILCDKTFTAKPISISLNVTVVLLPGKEVIQLSTLYNIFHLIATRLLQVTLCAFRKIL